MGISKKKNDSSSKFRTITNVVLGHREHRAWVVAGDGTAEARLSSGVFDVLTCSKNDGSHFPAI